MTHQKKITAPQITSFKRKGRKIAMITAYDATSFIARTTPNDAGGAVDPVDPTLVCVGGLTTEDVDGDGEMDTFDEVEPGTPVCFDIYPKMNVSVEETGEPQLFMAYVDVVGDSVTVLDTREVFFLVPPSDPIVE